MEVRYLGKFLGEAPTAFCLGLPMFWVIGGGRIYFLGEILGWARIPSQVFEDFSSENFLTIDF